MKIRIKTRLISFWGKEATSLSTSKTQKCKVRWTWSCSSRKVRILLLTFWRLMSVRGILEERNLWKTLTSLSGCFHSAETKFLTCLLLAFRKLYHWRPRTLSQIKTQIWYCIGRKQSSAVSMHRQLTNLTTKGTWKSLMSLWLEST